MSEAPRSRRRWFQFSLRTFLLAVAVLGVWLGWNLRAVRQRESLLDELASRQAIVRAWSSGPVTRADFRCNHWDRPRTIPWSWSLLGAIQIDEMFLEDGRFTLDDVDRFEALFPDSRIHRVRSVGHGVVQVLESVRYEGG